MPLTTLTLKYFLSQHSPIQNVVDPRMINSQALTAPVNTRDINDLLTRYVATFLIVLLFRSIVSQFSNSTFCEK